MTIQNLCVCVKHELSQKKKKKQYAASPGVYSRMCFVLLVSM